MGTQSSNSDCGYAHRRLRGSGSRPGVAKDQLIFIIICSVALAVAAVALVQFFRGGSKVRPSSWQCLDANCGHEFTRKKPMSPLVECSKCGGTAAMLRYRPCPACGERVLVGRMRVSGQIPAGGPGGPGGLGGRGMAMMQPMDIQYRIQQDDGTYIWTLWVPAGSPQSMQMEQSLVCPKCGEGISYLRR
jgi:DNA-directed RNA polymerase subunit RPC12/RpoP